MPRHIVYLDSGYQSSEDETEQQAIVNAIAHFRDIMENGGAEFEIEVHYDA